MNEARDFDDQAIIAATVVEQGENGASRLAITLPSGRVLRSDEAQLAELQRQMITWCNAVRNQVSADSAAEAAERRRSQQAAAPASPQAPYVPAASDLTPAGVLVYAAARIEALNKELEAHALAIQVAEQERELWRHTVKALDGKA